MNIFKRFYCRSYQLIFKCALPFLPYRKPILLKDEADILKTLITNGKTKPIIVTDKVIQNIGLIYDLEIELKKNNISYCIFNDINPNPTSENVESLVNFYLENKCDCIIAFGGGSIIDSAKALGARIAKPKKELNQMKGLLKINKKIPLLIAVPTTAGTGSEATIASVIIDSETRHKYCINDFSLIPSYAMLKPSLTKKLSAFLTATTGMDALTHAIEAYLGRTTTKATRQLALEAIKLIFEHLFKAYSTPEDLNARENMLLASYYAGLAFTKSYVGYVHAVSHSLSGEYDVAHGLANAVILPKVLIKYGKKIYSKLWKIGIYCGLFNKDVSKQEGAKILIEYIQNLNKKMAIPESLDCIKEDDISRLAKIADKEANPLYPVPVLFNAKELESVYYEVKNG